jgi:hypothetical protein
VQQEKASGGLPKGHALYAPGLKWRPRVGGDVPMWIPPGPAIKAGYLPKSLMLDRNATQYEIAEVCRKQWCDLEEWRSGKHKPVKLTISWLIDRYLGDLTSPFHTVKPDTQQSYRWECKRIRETVGEMRLDPKLEGGIYVPRRTGEDFRRWFLNWGHPPGKPPTPSRATHCIAMLRTLIGYYVTIGGQGGGQLRDILSEMRFEKSPARSQTIIYEQVDAIVNKAEEMGFRSIAIATLAQYELIERRAHIIGQWDGDTWADGWVWEGVSPDWVISYYQTKTGRVRREFDLKPVQRLLGLLQLTPKEARRGPIVLCEATGEPWVKRRYQETFRRIARAAGVPDEIFSMDMRSGGVTEADGIAGITPRMIQDGAGHRDIHTQEIYRRDRQRNANKVVVLRQAARNRS